MEFFCTNSQNQDEKKMSDATADGVMREMRGSLVEVAGSRAPGETIERWLERGARRLGITYARAFNYWHCRVRRVDAHEADNIRNRAKAHAARRVVELRAELARLEGSSIAQNASAPVDAVADRVLAGP